MTQFAKIIEHNHLVRDIYSKAILNTDTSIVRKHEKRMYDLQKEEVREKEFILLKNEIQEIRKILHDLMIIKEIIG